MLRSYCIIITNKNPHMSNPAVTCGTNNFPCNCSNEWDGVLNHQRLDCLLNRLSWRRSKETSKLRVNGLCEGNSPVTGEFPAQMASNAEMFLFDDAIMRD